MEFADSANRFAAEVTGTCDELMAELKQLQTCLDEVLFEGINRGTLQIKQTVEDHRGQFGMVAQRASAYAQYVSNIEKKLAQSAGGTGTSASSGSVSSGITASAGSSSSGSKAPSKLRMTLCGAVCAVQMRTSLKQSFSTYESRAGYWAGKCVGAVKLMQGISDIRSILSGNHLTPSGMDESDGWSAVNTMVNSFDMKMAANPKQRIQHYQSTVPQSQIQSHTLVVNDPNDP